MKTPGWILTILISILMAAVLELNQNTLFGWLLFALAFVGVSAAGGTGPAWRFGYKR